ncbi:M48 family metalloprotease [Plectonema radiosum NIES-515]|uniref:M48 family metalloprotease n=1 Tax=Plectonema radiosum NIES-515 TaxID=2986073 RepID=A0ABT3AUB0_9CYAN|nr:M48 family metalloprotease [Plectonema radiosum]MCV3212711.1 M48 family metalloprotease [Plectonema radiosum NIES-515]
MKRRWKSLLLAWNWVLLSLGTSILIILTQPISPVPAQQPPAIETTEKKPSIPEKPPSTPETTEKKPSIPETTDKKPSDAAEPTPTPEELARRQKLMEGDKLYLAGNLAEAEKMYRLAKAPFTTKLKNQERKAPIIDPTQLSPAGKVYWREAEAGIATKLQTRTLVPLQLLVEQIPEFIPGQIKYAETLKQYNDEKKALAVLDRAATLYPNQPDLIKARVAALAEAKKWIEASLAARQFAILNSNDPQAPEFQKLADDNLKRYKSHIRAEVRGNTIANIITGALGYALTGSLLGPFSALDSTILLLQGEGSIGESVAKQAKKQLKLINDETVLKYVDEIGQKLVKVSGREEFKYEFFIIALEDLNAFALPGGKIFINAGAIAKANSEAELAGLIGHELSHVVLSHGFQLVTQGNLISNVTQYLPLGGTIGQLFGLSYSRDMERQADTLGTRLIATSGYACDGLRNLLVTLEKQQKNAPPTWLSSHPGGGERVKYLESLISDTGYNRYAYEGVGRHQEIKERVKQLLKEKKEREEQKKKPNDESKK